MSTGSARRGSPDSGRVFPGSLEKSLVVLVFASVLILIAMVPPCFAVTPGYVEIQYDVSMSDIYHDGENPVYGNPALGTLDGTLTIRFELDQSAEVLEGGSVEIVELDLDFDVEQTVFIPNNPPYWWEIPWLVYYDLPDRRWDGIPESTLTSGAWSGHLVVPPGEYPDGIGDTALSEFETAGGCGPGSEIWPGEPYCMLSQSPVAVPIADIDFGPLIQQPPTLPIQVDEFLLRMNPTEGHPYFDFLDVRAAELPNSRTLVQVDSGRVFPGTQVPGLGPLALLLLGGGLASAGMLRAHLG